MAAQPLTVGFPLRGEWCALNTPAHKVPSHGTDYLAQTYAYDFTRLSWKGGAAGDFHHKRPLQYFLGRVKLRDCYAWSQPGVAPFAGTVVSAKDGWPERRIVHMATDLLAVVKNGLFFNDAKAPDLRPLAGNYLILKGPSCYAFLAHLKTDSITVEVGDEVASGQILGEVGHSGSSTAPHLHFQLMDGPDPRVASGLPCNFASYEMYSDGAWRRITNGLPGRLERIRCE